MKRRFKSIAIVLLFISTLVQASNPWDHGKLEISSDGHMLKHHDGTGFFWMGDTAWHMMFNLTETEIDTYLTNREKKGFSVIQIIATDKADGKFKTSREGNHPFVGENPLKHNEDYWKKLDNIIDKAKEKGLYIALLPTWENQIDNTNNVAEYYATWIAKRYKGKDNIIWVLGGDVVLASYKKPKWNAMGQAIKEVDNKHLITFHANYVSDTSTYFADSYWLDFHMIQSGHRVNDTHTSQGINRLRDYYSDTGKPVLDGEPRYEKIHPHDESNASIYVTAYQVRLMAYKQLFSGAFGHTYGHNSIWQFCKNALGDGSKFECTRGWNDSLNDPGASNMKWVRNLMTDYPILERVPDQSLIVSGKGIATRGKNYALVYLDKGTSSITIQMGKIAGSKVKAFIFNPKSGDKRLIRDSLYNNSGEQNFDINDSQDWVLILESAMPKAPKNFKTSKVTENSITLTWDDVSTTEDGFTLYMNGKYMAWVYSNTTSYTVKNLKPDTNYTFSISAKNGDARSEKVSVAIKTPKKKSDDIPVTYLILN